MDRCAELNLSISQASHTQSVTRVDVTNTVLVD